MTFPAELVENARALNAALDADGLMLATAESCTGGLVSALLTSIPGSSRVFDRAFVTYSNEAKQQMLGVPGSVIERHGAVSEETARAMAEGAVRHSISQIAVAITGIAGPDGGTAEKPVGLVHIACAQLEATTAHIACRFGDIGRDAIRLQSVKAAIALARRTLAANAQRGR